MARIVETESDSNGVVCSVKLKLGFSEGTATTNQ